MLGFADNRGTSLGLHIFLRGVDQMITRASLAFVVVLLVGLSGQPVDAQDSKDSKGVMVKGLVTSLGGFSATVNAPIFLTGATVDLEAGGETGRPQLRGPTHIYILQGGPTTLFQSGPLGLAGAPLPPPRGSFLGKSGRWGHPPETNPKTGK